MTKLYIWDFIISLTRTKAIEILTTTTGEWGERKGERGYFKGHLIRASHWGILEKGISYEHLTKSIS